MAVTADVAVAVTRAGGRCSRSVASIQIGKKDVWRLRDAACSNTHWAAEAAVATAGVLDLLAILPPGGAGRYDHPDSKQR